MTESIPESQDATASPRSFEEELAALEAATQELESGQPTLDGALRLYEEAVGSCRRCADLLRQAQRRIEVLRPESLAGAADEMEGVAGRDPAWQPVSLRSLAPENETPVAAEGARPEVENEG